jgi:NTP pyrophosphatase (non-canonical NTP hydrolase)
MNINDYQKKAMSTDAFVRPKEINVLSPAFLEKLLGISGESGELTDKIKKIIRDKEGKLSNIDRDEIVKEIGDILWYLSAVANYLDVTLETVARVNLEKLKSRKGRGVIKGSGDNR